MPNCHTLIPKDHTSCVGSASSIKSSVAERRPFPFVTTTHLCQVRSNKAMGGSSQGSHVSGGQAMVNAAQPDDRGGGGDFSI